MFKSLRIERKLSIKVNDEIFTFAEKLQIYNPNPAKIPIKEMNEDQILIYEKRKEMMQTKQKPKDELIDILNKGDMFGETTYSVFVTWSTHLQFFLDIGLVIIVF